LTGPDLQKATAWSADDLHAAVKRMEKNVGPMSDERVSALVSLLKSGEVQKRLEAAKERRRVELTATLVPGSPATGRDLFFGAKTFASGGIPCAACHAVGGEGGNMAVDLTAVYPRLGEQSLMSTIERPAFPLMKTAYGAHVVSSQEAMDLSAFFKSVGKGLPRDASVPPRNLAALHGTAAGLVIVALGGVAWIFRSRRGGLRRRMLRDSYKR
ncbi:MAG: hypothetical protein WBX15_04610, partial [Thermoanaerobaculia bacterium]